MEKTEKIINEFEHFIQEYDRDIGLTNHDSEVLKGALTLLKERKPRIMTWDEVKKKINSGEYVFTECEKEGQWMRYGNAKLSIDQGDSCRIAFLSSGDRENNPHALWWWISYKNYNKTWRCWTTYPTYAQREATPWIA